ncbi:MAG TPA: 50S ribosomal protein L22 [Candidatus Altiarchaeales archaeon]|nr:MAG: 50S ribosomal protein L22 [Candidatus Altiarchaeales archaeon]HDN83408.1 50S ribosomal protein L22 [Candidatus Altiarchaeales archaeon]
MEIGYAYKTKEGEKVAKAMGRDLDISLKKAVEICSRLRGMKLKDAIKLLEAVSKLEKSIPFTRYKSGVGHRKGLRGKEKIGKFPQKAALKILDVLRNLQSNAEYKGLDAENLKIVNIQAKKGITRLRRKPKGRWRPWRRQLVHIEVVAKEG